MCPPWSAASDTSRTARTWPTAASACGSGLTKAALAISAAFFVLALLGAYLVVGAAHAHAAHARTPLGPYVDPLAAAKRMLAEPGSLTP